MDGRSWEMPVHSILTRSPDVIRLLLERAVNVDSVDSDGCTPLMRLLSQGRTAPHVYQVFEILFSFGASCTIRNHEGNAVADMALAKHFLVAERIKARVKEENWQRRMPFFQDEHISETEEKAKQYVQVAVSGVISLLVADLVNSSSFRIRSFGVNKKHFTYRRWFPGAY